MGTIEIPAASRRLLFRLHDALDEASCLDDLSDHAYPLLASLVSSDLGAMCTWRPQDQRYDWLGNLPGSWFAAYPQIAAHDFVREAVMRAPFRALVDAQMIEPQEKRRSPLYQRARDFSLDLEHAMSVLLTDDGGDDLHPGRWHGGMTLYRTGLVPFAELEATLLQEVAIPFARAFKRCLRLRRTLGARDLDTWLRGLAPLEAAVLDRDLREIARTPGLTDLLSAWFPETREKGHLPPKILERVVASSRPGRTIPRAAPLDFVERRDDAVLLCWIDRQPPTLDFGEWAIVLEERGSHPIPPAWESRLTERKIEIARLVTLGWSNQEIAAELSCKLPTVVEHLRVIFDQLGVSSRTALCHQAFEQARHLRRDPVAPHAGTLKRSR